MSKKIVFSLMAILLAVGLVGAGAFAQFFDTETSEDNTFTAGTLNLKVGSNDPCTEHMELPVHPYMGGEYSTFIWKITNTGNLDGELSVTFSAITNNDNDCNEPEEDAEESRYGVGSATCGDGEGELGEYLRISAGWGGDGYFVPWRMLNAHGEETYTSTTVLKAEETKDFWFRYDTRQSGLGGNLVQSDSVEFDIIFHLDQAP